MIETIVDGQVQQFLDDWVDSHSEPDKNIMYIGQGNFTPRQISNMYKEAQEPIFSLIDGMPVETLTRALEKKY